jgi:hypothetical protein
MGMDRSLAVRPDSHISDQRCDFDLLIHGDRQIALGFPVEIGKLGAPKRADRREACSR